ncbi:MAG: hypothetical protein CM15mP120_25900 [Pseudomonadota bacterium]|nr:MAG: hypothetical protein CM15mP120_25900 [Pseudomonadota bacterium]
MAVGRIGWVKKAISAVAMIALVFGLSVRPAFAAEAPAGEGSSGGSASSTTSGTGAVVQVRRWCRCRAGGGCWGRRRGSYRNRRRYRRSRFSNGDRNWRGRGRSCRNRR